MNTAAYRRRRQLKRQRRQARRVEFARKWRENGGIDGYLRLMYPPEVCRGLTRLADDISMRGSAMLRGAQGRAPAL